MARAPLLVFSTSPKMALFISKYLGFFIFRLSEIELIARFRSTAKSGFILAIFLFSINPPRYPS